MSLRTKIFLFVLLSNVWIWHIFRLNFIVGLLVLLSSILIFHREKKAITSIIFALLILVQVFTTQINPLGHLNQVEYQVNLSRLNAYPQVSFNFLNKKSFIPIAHWFEGRGESIAFFQLERNFFETLDPNIYFFAGHPRERGVVGEFNKFPFITLPFFIWGIVPIKNRKFALTYFLLPILILSLIGHSNPFGPTILFPAITISTSQGITKFHRFLKSKKIADIPFIFALLAVFIFAEFLK